MSPIERIRPASQEEIGEVRFVRRRRGEKETGRKQKARKVIEIIKEHPGAVVSFTGSRYSTEAYSFASLVREIARSEDELEVQTTIRREEEPGKHTMFLRELPEEDILLLKREPSEEEISENSPVLTWIFKTLAAIEEVCPSGPVSPESFEFGYLEEEGRDSMEMFKEWEEFQKKYTNEKGELDLGEYCDWGAEIPCPDCQTPLIWSRAIGYNNHVHVRCTGCGMAAHL